MKKMIFLSFLIAGQGAFADLKMECKNSNGVVRLESTEPCKGCRPGTPAFNFIDGDGVLSDGIPAYDSSMPGYIDFDDQASKALNEDIISLVDGGTWWISMHFPQGFLTTKHEKGEAVQAVLDSSYDDIDVSELNGIKLNCVVQ